MIAQKIINVNYFRWKLSSLDIFYPGTVKICKKGRWERMPRDMSDWEKAIRHALLDRCMSVSDLAKELDISNAYLYDILSGTRKATDLRQKINDFLGLEGDW